MPRPVHYAAHGSGGLAFKCFFEEYEQHRNSPVTEHYAPGVKLYPRKVHKIGWPLRTTDLNKVTCPKCWAEIQDLSIRAIGSPARRR